MNAGAEQVPGDQGAAQAPVADQADAAAADSATPPATLPWGAKPQRVHRGRAGATSQELRAQGLQAAADDNSHHLDFAPKGRLARSSFLKSEPTDVKPPVPPLTGATPSASATSAPATTAPATTAPATAAATTTAAAATTTAATTAPATSSATTSAVQPLAATGSPSTGTTTTPPVTGGDDGSATFSYADTYETTTADGIYAAMDVKKPVLGSGDFHTLAEIAVQSGDPQHLQTIEVGWTVDRAVNGDDDPHLFIFHWINGVPTCYNTCGKFIPYAGGVAPGDTLPADTLKKFGIQHSDTGWWIAYDTTWVGHFLDSEWTDQGVKFTQGGFFQAWGEVAGASNCPTGTQMGNGVAPAAESTSTAARIANVGYVNGPATATLTRRILGSTGYNLTFFKDSAGNVSTKSFRYGGTPAVVPDPDKDKAAQGATVCAVSSAKS